MKNKSKLIVGSTLGLGLLVSGASVHAQDISSTSRPNIFSRFVTAIAQKFNLSESDVKSVIEAEQTKMQTETQARQEQDFSDRLAGAVANGRLTQAQADAIKTEHASVKSQLDALKGQTSTDTREAMKKIMDAEKKWATDNNIPVQYLMRGGTGMGRDMMGRGHW